MDKVKIKSVANEVKVIIDELVAEGKIDGDTGKSMLNQIVQSCIQREVTKDSEVV